MLLNSIFTSNRIESGNFEEQDNKNFSNLELLKAALRYFLLLQSLPTAQAHNCILKKLQLGDLCREQAVLVLRMQLLKTQGRCGWDF